MSSESPRPASEWKEAQAKEEPTINPERTKTYPSPEMDPAYREVQENIVRLAREVSDVDEAAKIHEQQWNAFSKAYPEKAAAYGKLPVRSESSKENEVLNYEEVSVPDANAVFHEALEFSEDEAASERVANEEKLAEIRQRLEEHAEAMHYMAQEENGIEEPMSFKEQLNLSRASSEHAEAMNTLAQEENGIEKPTSLKEDHESLEKLTEAFERSKNTEAAAGKSGGESKQEKPKKTWIEKSLLEKGATIGAWTAGTAVVAGVGLWVNASVLGAFGLGPSSAAVGLSMAGIGAGAAFVGSMVIGDIFYWQLIKNLWTEGSAWLKKISGGVLSGGSGGGGGHAPAAKKAGGGGDHGHH